MGCSNHDPHSPLPRAWDPSDPRVSKVRGSTTSAQKIRAQCLTSREVPRTAPSGTN